jgi:hypothetical protein
MLHIHACCKRMFKCFRCFICMLQVFYLDVAYVFAMATHTYFQVFSSVLVGVSGVCCKYFSCF